MKFKKNIVAIFFIFIFFNIIFQNAFAIEELVPNSIEIKSNNWFAKHFKIKNKNHSKEKSKNKRRVLEAKLPPIIQDKPNIHYDKLTVMTIEDCVEYAINHNPNLLVSQEEVNAAKSGIGKARSNYAPKLTGKVSYEHTSNFGDKTVNNAYNNAVGFNVGISEMIWDFGKTTAKINMYKFNMESLEYDHEFELLKVIYAVKIYYYNVLSALANLDIYEQNVRINQLNYERTKAMFDEGLKSKIDVVNAEVNLTDAKIKLVEGQNTLEAAIIQLNNEMYYEEDKPFVVTNTENFNFLNIDYKEKMGDLTSIKTGEHNVKKNDEGLIMLSGGIEHEDIVKNYEFKPLILSKREAVEKALSSRPDLKSHDMLTKVQEESLKAIKRQYAPELTADLTWGYAREQNRNSSPLMVGAGIGLGSINPYGIHYQIKEGEAYLDIAYHNLNIAKSDIFWEVQKNYINMRQLERKIPLLNLKVKATLENFELADGRYSEGLSNYVELQDSIAKYNTAQLNFVEAVFKYNVARETLLKSMGVK